MVISLLFLIPLGVLSYIFVGIYRSYAIKKNILGHPNQRSLHAYPIPRGGGIVFPLLWSIFLIFLYFIDFIKITYLLIFLPPTFLISIIGFLDDKYQVAARFRFLTQLGAVFYVLFIVGSFAALNIGITVIHWGWFGYIFTILALLWSTNLYNFMDGIDGIAAIEALFVFGFGGYFVWCAKGYDLAIIIWSLAIIVILPPFCRH